MLVIIGGFVFRFGSYLLSFFFILNFFNFFNFLFFNNFTYFFLYFFLFSPFSSEPCGRQGLGAPAGCQDCASKVG